jgi:hypothetical protein
MKTFNRAVWLKDLKEAESQISALKKQIHQPHTVELSKHLFTYGLVNGPDGPVRVSKLVGQLHQLTATATALYALRRQVKDKTHPLNKGWVWRSYMSYDNRKVMFATPLQPGLSHEQNNNYVLRDFDTSKYFTEVAHDAHGA